jgi:tetratricopeptide (TPR) repeat protein
MSKKKDRSYRKAARTTSKKTISKKLFGELDHVDRLISGRQWSKAREILESLNKQFPNRKEVLVPLLHTYFRLQDWQMNLELSEQLIKLFPRDPDFAFISGAAYLANGWLFLGLRDFQHSLDRWPTHPKAPDARQTVATLREQCKRLLTELGFPEKDGHESAALHEEVQWSLDQGKYQRGKHAAEKLLQRHPDFVPVLNNLSEIYFRDGEAHRAIATVRRVLTMKPNNYHALSNLTRYLCLMGRSEEAQVWADRVKPLCLPIRDLWVKKAEALSYLGDDQAVLEALHGFEQAGHSNSCDYDAQLYHLAAVASWRLGQEPEARRLWQKALQSVPDFDLARKNLEDLKSPVAERNAPWPFSMNYWVLKKTVDDLHACLKKLTRRPNRNDSQVIQGFLQLHPELVKITPLLLDRGDPPSRKFAVMLATTAKTPELLAALKEFAFSHRGSDDLRMRAAQTLSEIGMISNGTVKMWLKGESREIRLLGYEVHDEPARSHPPAVLKLAQEGWEATQQGQGELAEKLYKQALELKPDAPDLLNNLAMAYIMLGMAAKGESLIRDIHQRFPDYLFARVSVARLYVREGNLEKARGLLEPLHARKRFHVSEFLALCKAEIEWQMAKFGPTGARTWLEMWERTCPDDPELPQWRFRVAKGSNWDRLEDSTAGTLSLTGNRGGLFQSDNR